MATKKRTRARAESQRSMTAAERARFMDRLVMLNHLDKVREILLASDGFALEALALEAIRVVSERSDAESRAEIETVLRRVLNRHWRPETTDHGFTHPSRRLSFAAAARLLSAILGPCHELAEGGREATRRRLDAEGIPANAYAVLTTFVEYFPGRRTEDELRAAICDAAREGRSMLGETLRAWGCPAKVVKEANQAVRRQK